MTAAPQIDRVRRSAGRVAAAAFVLVVVAATGAVVGSGASRAVDQVVFTAVTIVYLVAGLIIVERRPGNRIGGIVLVIGVAIGAYLLLDAVVRLRLAPELVLASALVVGLMDAPFYFLVGSLFVLFPDGRLPSRRWKVVPAASAATGTLVLLGALARPGPLGYYDVQNPFADPTSPFLVLWAPAYMAQVALVGVAALSLVARWRHGGAVTRAQVKWMVAAGLVLAFAMLSYGGTIGPGAYSEFGDLTVGLGFAMVPAAITVAILRYRLYDIDRIVSRTIGWAIVSGILVVVFTMVVVGLQAVLANVTQGQTLAVAASTLVGFALFQPLRRRVQRAVDRRFDRARYDADRTAAGLADRLRDRVDLLGIEADLADTVRTALRPGSSAVWLRHSTDG